jgi:CheY-like chemotaxis protein
MQKNDVLIIEDDPMLNNVFSLALKGIFEIHSITDGTQALQYLAEHAPDLVVLDMNLPGASGSEILAYIRSQERMAQTRVILATADALQANRLQDDADLILLKPVSPIQLRELASRIKQN